MNKTFLFTLLITTLITSAVIGITYVRFFILKDYVIEYSVACDPYSEHCFSEVCDEEDCEMYYFSIMRKNAHDLYGACGTDIEECEFATICTPMESACVLSSCDPVTDSCAHFEMPTEPEAEEGTTTDERAE